MKLIDMNLKTGQAYRMKPAIQQIYAECEDPITTGLRLQEWTSWALCSRLGPMIKAARAIIYHCPGIRFKYVFTEKIISTVRYIIWNTSLIYVS